MVEDIKDVGLEVNTEETKYIVMSCHQNAGQDHNIMMANKSIENVAKFQYLGTAANENCIQAEIKTN